MRVGSLFTGIGGFDLGFEKAGHEIAWQCEIDEHCRAVLAKHWPGIPVYKDVKEVGVESGRVDVIVGGFPCQDVSVAGRRAGLAGERSGLWFEFHRVVAEVRPAVVVIENVPGLLSSNRGRDFAVILRGLGELGYGVAWRILDAQYVGVAQRRRRVFVVGHLGGAGRAAEVLFEREGVPGHPPARRAPGEDVAGTLGGSSQSGNFRTTDLDNNGAFVVADSHAIQERAVSENPATGPDGAGWKHEQAYTLEARSSTQIVATAFRSRYAQNGRGAPSAVAYPLTAEAGQTGKGDSANLVVFDPTQVTSPGNYSNPQSGNPCHPLAAGAHVPTIAYALAARNAKGVSLLDGQDTFVTSPGAVRRLTPVECERLQSFPDGWTGEQANSHRYRQLGNAVCVNVSEWIGRRLA